MKLKLFCVAFLVLATTFYTSCSKSHSPLAPASTSFTTVKVPLNTNGHVSNVSSYSLDYTITGTGVAPVTGNIGPIPNSQIINGFYSFTLDLTSTGYDLFSAVVNDAQAQTVCAVGAQSFTYLAGSTIPVTIGPINPCYTVTSLQPGYAYGFEGNTTTNVGVNQPTSIPGLDMVCNQPSLGVNLLENASLAVNTVAYLGNGNWSSYLTVPPTTSFYVSSGQSKGFVTAGNPSAPNSYPAAVGDVYCVKILAGGYAWLQVTSITGGLSFIFRPNTTLSYCGYERTTSDIAGLCNAAATPTNTSVVTNTFTATLTPTNTPVNTNTSTATNTPVFTNTSTPTFTPTNTSVFTNTSTATMTPTNTSTNTSIFTSTFTPTSTPTNTPLNTNTSTPTSTPTFTWTDSPTSTATNTPLNTATSTNTGTPTNTDTVTSTFTATSTFTPIPPNGGVVSTFAGTGVSGSQDGAGTSATFNWPTGVCVDASDNVYVADYSNDLIRVVTSAGVVSTLAGQVGVAGSANGVGTAASFSSPLDVAVNAAGTTVYVADYSNNLIRAINVSSGLVSTFAGSGTAGAVNGTGTAASFNQPAGLCVDSSGNVYVADEVNNMIRAITPGGVVTTLAGSGTQGATNGTGTGATFYWPWGICLNAPGNILYITEFGGNDIRQVIVSGASVDTLAGSGAQGSANGTGTAATFYKPRAIAVDVSSNAYVADNGNNLIREISSSGVVTTLAGSGTAAVINGTGLAAAFNEPAGIAVDGLNHLFVGDESGNEIREIQ